MLRRAFELMTDRAGALAELIVLENGKTLCDAKGEVAYAVEFVRCSRQARSANARPGAWAGAQRIAESSGPVQ